MSRGDTAEDIIASLTRDGFRHIDEGTRTPGPQGTEPERGQGRRITLALVLTRPAVTAHVPVSHDPVRRVHVVVLVALRAVRSFAVRRLWRTPDCASHGRSSPYARRGWGLTMDELLTFTKHQPNRTQEEK